jgi:hypothetical protein
MSNDPILTYRFVVSLFGIGIIVSTLEYLSILSEFGAGGIYSWEIIRPAVSRRTRAKSIQRLHDLIYSERGVTVLLVLRLAATVSLMLLPFHRPIFSIAAALLVGTHLVFSARQVFGEDGSDQMNSLVALTVLACVGPQSSSLTLNLGLWFLALQACLSYFSAGIAKVFSEIWRSGAAVRHVFSTGSYGAEPVAVFLARHNLVAASLSWGVILFEVLFPACILLPAGAMWWILGCGIAFHLLNAIIMGLNSFFWSFLATYPALVYVGAAIRGP